jgi:enterobactin synthetase component F
MSTSSKELMGEKISNVSNAAELEQNIYSLFDRQVQMNPDAVAVVARGETATYAQLAERVGSICNLLAQQGLVAEQPVGILMHRSVGMLAAMLAVLRTGAAYLPLDPDDPMDRHRRMLAISGCQLVLADETLCRTLEAGLDGSLAVRFVTLDKLEARARKNTRLPVAPGGSRLAYILFTSGSTGEPKGVEVEHRSVVNLLLEVRDLVGFTAADRFLAVATIAFDISVVELFLPLACGGSLLLRDRILLAEPVELAEEVVRHNVSIMQTGASLWASILSQQPDFPQLRVIVSTSEAISQESARRLLPYGEQVWNLYGPTEATVWATGCHLTEASCQAGKGSNISAPIGRAIANAEVFVLDKELNPVAGSESGELCIGGPGLARGYLNDSLLTEKQFITEQKSGKRLYRTGDLVSWNSDNQLNYLGRIDDQLQIKGVRVEPREVESTILLNPCVQETATAWYDTPHGARSIVAAVVLKPGKQLSSGELHEWLASKLPAQMIPSRYLFKESLALTSSGKIDRNAIREAVTAASLDAGLSGSSRPATAAEELLARIWQRLLAVESVAPEDHFFAIGGDSLAAVRMLLEAEACLDVTLTVQMVYEDPTLERFAARIERIKQAAGNADESSYVFQLTGDGDGRPVFFNNVNLTIASAGKWSLPCPLYSISYWAKGSGFLEVDSLEELAAAHIAEIRKIQPQGPYRLAGFSFGGLIAFEIARQFTARGETVESLFLVEPREPDSILVGGRNVSIVKHESMPARIGRHIKALFQQPGDAVNYIGHRLMPTIQLNNFTRWLAYKIMHVHVRRKSQVARLLVPRNQGSAIKYYIDRLISDYVAEPYAGPVRAVFGDYDDFGHMASTWGDLIGADAIFHIPEATHSSLFSEPALGQWMAVLADGLDITVSRSG